MAQAQQTAEVLQQVEQLTWACRLPQQVIDAAAEDNAAYHVMLTNPDMLAAYVDDFFGPEGPYPTETLKIVSAPKSRPTKLALLNLKQAPAPQAPAYQRP